MNSLAQIYLMEHELISADGFQVPGRRTRPGSVTWTNGMKRWGSAEGPGVFSHKQSFGTTISRFLVGIMAPSLYLSPCFLKGWNRIRKGRFGVCPRSRWVRGRITPWTGQGSITGHTPVTHTLTSPFTVFNHAFWTVGGKPEDPEKTHTGKPKVHFNSLDRLKPRIYRNGLTVLTPHPHPCAALFCLNEYSK